MISVEDVRKRLLAPPPCNQEAAEKVAKQLYAKMNRSEPKLVWFDDPVKAIAHLAFDNVVRDGNFYIPHLVNELLNVVLYGLPSPAPEVVADLSAMRAQVEVQNAVWRGMSAAVKDKAVYEPLVAFNSDVKVRFDAAFNPASTGRGDGNKEFEAVFSHVLKGAMHPAWAMYYQESLAKGVESSPIPIPQSTIDVIGVRLELATHLGWWWPLDKTVVLTPSPAFVRLNDDNELHCDDGPCVEYVGGRKIWAIDGVPLPKNGEQIVMDPKSQTVPEISAEPNEEVKRIRIERFGRLEFLRGTGAKCIDRRMNERDGQPEELYQDSAGAKFISLVDPSTGRQYVVNVDVGVNTCQDAQNWMSHGLDDLAIHRS